jgi:hypothetical protein
MDKKQREERRRQEDIALQRGLLWVVGAVVLEALLVLVNRFYINYSLSDAGIQLCITLHEVLRVLRIAAPIAAVLALAWAVWQFRQKKKYALPLILAIALAAAAVCVHVIIKYQSAGLSMLYWLVVAWAVLALVFYIYQREFFLAAAACGMSVLGLWFVRYGLSGQKEAIALLLAVAVAAGVVFWLKKTDGLLPGGGEEARFLPKQTSYTVPLATCGASAAALIAAMILGSSVAYYLIFVMVAWLFALFVYYTVKLM